MSSIIKSSRVKSGKKFRLSSEISDRIEKVSIDNSTNDSNIKELEKAKEEAARIIEEAKIKSEELLTQAQKEAEELKEKAEENIEAKSKEIFAQVQQEGYNKGFNSGKVEGKKEVVEKLQGLINNLAEESSSFQEKMKDRSFQLKDDMIRLSIAISKKIISRELEFDKELIKNIINDTISLLDDEEELIIRVSPRDLDVLGDYQEQLLTSNNGLEKVKIIDDENIGSGGCIIETDFGGFDATISSQLKEIEAKLLEVNNDE